MKCEHRRFYQNTELPMIFTEINTMSISTRIKDIKQFSVKKIYTALTGHQHYNLKPQMSGNSELELPRKL